jgi:pyruvate,water dikinase
MMPRESTQTPARNTKVLLNLGFPELAEKYARLPCDGVGLMRAEFLALSLGVHPRKLISEDGAEGFVAFFADQISKVAEAFAPRPVFYRTLDLKSNEYAGLEGGADYEEQEENPMLGFRGCSRYLDDAESFKLELQALKRVLDRGQHNLRMLLPFVRFPREIVQCREWIEQAGLFEYPGFELWMMVEVPANVFLIDEFLPHVSGVSIGSNDLTQLVLGIDRDNRKLADQFDMREPAVLAAIERIAVACRARGVPLSICGDAPSRHPEIIDKLVGFGLSSFSVSAEAFETTLAAVAEAEARRGIAGHSRSSGPGGS